MRPRYVRPKFSYDELIEKVDVGDKTSDVVEVLRFISSDRLLRPKHACDLDYLVITDFEQAKEYAFYATAGDTGYTWTNIGEHEISEIDCKPAIQKTPELKDAMDEIYYELEKNMDKKYFESILGNLDFELVNCLRYRAEIGPQDNFLETLFAIYKQGCWPCGWEGNYPEGTIVVYQPPMQS